MTLERANEIVAGVTTRHKAFVTERVYLFGTYAAVTFKRLTVDPRRVSVWFDEVGAYVVQTGYDNMNSEWFAYFREDNTK